MTKEELIKKMGNDEDRANWVMGELLRNVKPAFIEMMLKSKEKQQKKMFQEKEASGYYMDKVDYPEDFNYFSYLSAMEDGNDDGTKKAWIEKYELQEDRWIEKALDKRMCNFYSNMVAIFLSN